MASNAKQRETCFYTFLYSMSPARSSLSSSLSLLVPASPLVPSYPPSRVPLPSRQLSSLCLVQLTGSSDHDESFLLDSHPPSYPSPLLSVSRCSPYHFSCSFLSSLAMRPVFLPSLLFFIHSRPNSDTRYSHEEVREYRRILPATYLSIKLIKISRNYEYTICEINQFRGQWASSI